MESTSDRVVAVAGSVGVHALVILVLYLGLLQQPELAASGSEGPAIEATLVSTPTQVAAAIRRIEAPPVEHPAAPPPQPTPERAPQDAPTPQQLKLQERIPQPDTVNQDEVRREGELAAKEKVEQEQEQRHKQAQLDLSRLQDQLEEENRQRLAQQQLEKTKQLADIRKAKADADRQVKIQEEKLKQLADLAAQNNPSSAAATTHTPTPQQTASSGPGTSLKDRYIKAINAVVNQNWRSDGVPEKVHCEVTFKQIPGGQVFDVSFGDCPFDAAGRKSVEEALNRTPLPYSGFESVFEHEGHIDMCHPAEECNR